uniref:Iminophenyl-pyruvate dimer synthase domain-containing protein n=2 Tax=Ciona intestinalis TaxID=7719 RepID=H2XZ37_CIOIN
MIVELSTIPPYVTSWLSLQTEFGRNVEIADIVKSVFVEEMLHMSLAANLINSVGGTVNLTSMTLLPQYPTPLGSGNFFDLMPGVYVSIEPMSPGLARDLFAKIETPATEEEQKMFHELAELWLILQLQRGGASSPTSKNMQLLLKDYQKVKYKRKSALKSAMNKELTPNQTWTAIYDFAVKNLKILSSKPTNTIGALYLRAALFTAMVESCTQMNALNNPGSE